jgi:hypothetical protein
MLVNVEMMNIGQRFFNVKETSRLRLHAADGAAFIAAAPPHAFDVIILDVAAPARSVRDDAASLDLVGPTGGFLGDDVLGRHVWNTLRPGGVLAVNVLGGAGHMARVRACLNRCAAWPALLYHLHGSTTALAVALQVLRGACVQCLWLHPAHERLCATSCPASCTRCSLAYW